MTIGIKPDFLKYVLMFENRTSPGKKAFTFTVVGNLDAYSDAPPIGEHVFRTKCMWLQASTHAILSIGLCGIRV